jgi:hypothetical protein
MIKDDSKKEITYLNWFVNIAYAPRFHGCVAASLAAIGAAFLGRLLVGAGDSRAGVAELVDALDLGSSVARCGGSSPSARTMPTHWAASLPKLIWSVPAATKDEMRQP